MSDVLTAPRSHFGARIAGVNLVNGTVGPDGVAAGLRPARTGTGTRGHGLSHGQAAIAVFAPTAVAVYRDQPHGSPRNCVEVTVAELDIRGSAVVVRGVRNNPTAHRGWPPRSPSRPPPSCS